jgi:very-short-patch-repair endonuclease
VSEAAQGGRIRRKGPGRSASDEHYLINLCDEVLGLKAKRQHRFDFLRGDPGRNGRSVMLPVDAWYPDLNLVVEILERQHSESTPFFDRRLTVSGMSRGEQRRRYDARRESVLRKHGIQLCWISIPEIAGGRPKLKRQIEIDRLTVQRILLPYQNPVRPKTGEAHA